MTIDRLARENKVLEAIVRMHIKSALPVGSEYISRMLNLSSATIRNVMFELEKKGLVRQPHISAGRIPTDLGYRRYVDDMISEMETPPDELLNRVRKVVNRKSIFEEIIEATSHTISEITSYTGIALSPNNKLYFDGTYHILEQPEFREPDIVRDFLRIVEDKNELMNIMSQDLQTDGIKIRIGRENVCEELKSCTVITSTYTVKRRLRGNIGVIGPIRMKYEKIVPLVENMSEMITEILEEIQA